MQKKPLIYLLVILPIFAGGACLLVVGLGSAYARFVGISSSQIPNINGFLIMLPAIFLWIPLALLLSNLVLFIVPPLRSIAEQYSAKTSHPRFLQSQSQLAKLATLSAAVCLPLIAVGFML